VPAPDIRTGGQLFYSDTWFALSDVDRRSVALVLGSRAAFMATVTSSIEVVAIVDEPLHAAAGLLERSKPMRRAVRVLMQEPDHLRARPAVNPQSRLLLDPWVDTTQMPHVPSDEDRAAWTDRLNTVEQQARLVPAQAAHVEASRLMGRLGLVSHEVEALRPPPALAPDLVEPIVRASWLDRSLYERASALADPGSGLLSSN
jgi:hypothetical protein